MSELGVTTNLSSGVATDFALVRSVEGCAVVGAGGVDGLLVHGLIVGGHGEAVDEGVFGDGAGFGYREREVFVGESVGHGPHPLRTLGGVRGDRRGGCAMPRTRCGSA